MPPCQHFHLRHPSPPMPKIILRYCTAIALPLLRHITHHATYCVRLFREILEGDTVEERRYNIGSTEEEYGHLCTPFVSMQTIPHT